MPVQPWGTGVPGGVGESVVTGGVEVPAVGCGAGWLTGTPPLTCV
ncbi:MAG: hypothetical protein ACXVRX_15215 [Solirubrobacteraceae bacterium]